MKVITTMNKQKAERALVPPERHTPDLAYSLQAIKELPMKVDFIRDPVTGFEGLEFSGQIRGDFGAIELNLSKDIKTKGENVQLLWIPPGKEREGEHICIDHDLGRGKIWVANALRQGGREGFSWLDQRSDIRYIGREDEISQRVEQIYRRIIIALAPKITYKPPEGEVEKRIKRAMEKGLENPAETFEEIKRHVLEQVAPPETHEKLPKPK